MPGRFTLRNRQRVEDTRGPVAVLLECTEKRGPVARRDALQDRQVQLEHAFAGVEHPTEVLTQAPTSSQGSQTQPALWWPNGKQSASVA